MWSRVGGRSTHTDIQYEDEEFNRAFTVNADDRKFASDETTQLMMEMLKADGRKEEWRIVGDQIYVVRKQKNSPDKITTGLELLSKVLDHIPEFVMRDAKSNEE